MLELLAVFFDLTLHQDVGSALAGVLLRFLAMDLASIYYHLL